MQVVIRRSIFGVLSLRDCTMNRYQLQKLLIVCMYACDVNVSHVADINGTNINVADDNDDVLETVVSVGNADDVDDSDVRETECNLPGSDVGDDREGDNDVFLRADDNLSVAHLMKSRVNSVTIDLWQDAGNWLNVEKVVF